MQDYISISLLDMIDQLGESYVNDILSSFSCPLNEDVEYFLKTKAIVFSKQGLSRTHLVFLKVSDTPVFVGYYCLAPKHVTIEKSALTKTLQKKINKFTMYDNTIKQHATSTALIAQLGKNFTNNNNKLIRGKDLLELAIQKVKAVQDEIGGRITYLECEDKKKLIQFYKENGFIEFGRRELEKDETDSFQGKYLIQMLRYI